MDEAKETREFCCEAAELAARRSSRSRMALTGFGRARRGFAEGPEPFLEGFMNEDMLKVKGLLWPKVGGPPLIESWVALYS